MYTNILIQKYYTYDILIVSMYVILYKYIDTIYNNCRRKKVESTYMLFINT